MAKRSRTIQRVIKNGFYINNYVNLSIALIKQNPNMNILDYLKNNILFRNKYKTHSEAVIIACYYNPHNSYYRLKAFLTWYETIKHLNHRIIECVIGDNNTPQLLNNVGDDKDISIVYTKNLLWHKETLLNKIIKSLPAKYKYVFWLDTDIIFTNLNWLTESVQAFKDGYNILQPFEYCVHLEKDELKPNFNYEIEKNTVHQRTIASRNGEGRYPTMWRSFAANCANNFLYEHKNYDIHGHVGFAWGIKRSILDKCPLYERALIGGGDHIIAHAAMGQIPHNCITNSFSDPQILEDIESWSKNFYKQIQGKVMCITGDLFHLWHGDLKNRDYYNRVKEFSPRLHTITEKDNNGLYITSDEQDEKYMQEYFKRRDPHINIKKAKDDQTYEPNYNSGNGNQAYDQFDPIDLLWPINPLSPFILEDNFKDAGGQSGGGGAGGSWPSEVKSDIISESNNDVYIQSTPSGNFS